MSDLVVMDFFAEWCSPCKMMNPILEKMKQTYPDVEFKKVNIDKEGTMGFDIQSVPHFVFQHKGKKVYEHKGVIPPAKFGSLVEQYKESM